MSAIKRAYHKADGSKLSAAILQHLLYAMLLTIAGYYGKSDARMLRYWNRTFKVKWREFKRQ